MDNWNSSVPSSRHCTFHDAHVASQHTSCPTEVSLFRLFGQMTLTRPAAFLVCWTSNRHKADATRSPTTGRSAHSSSAPSSLSSSSSPTASSLSPRCFCGCTCSNCRNFCGHSLSPGGPRRQCSQGQVLLHSLATCSPRSVFLSSATFVSLESCPKAKLLNGLPQACTLY